MKKTYALIPVISGLSFACSLFSLEVALLGFFVMPITAAWWFNNNKVDIFLEASQVKERICFIALSSRELIPFLAEKVDDEWIRIKNKFIKTTNEDRYVYKGKVLMFAIQKDGMQTKEILELKSSLDPGFLSSRVLLSSYFWKWMIFPVMGSFLMYFLPSMSFIAWMIIFGGPVFMIYIIWQSGALDFAKGQGSSDITIFYIQGSRKLIVAEAESIGERWYSYKDGPGNVKTTDGTDYYLNGKKVYFSGAGVPTTFSLELANKAHELRELGLRTWREFEEVMKKIDNENEYDSIEEALKEKGREYVEKALEESTKMREVKNIAQARI